MSEQMPLPLRYALPPTESPVGWDANGSPVAQVDVGFGSPADIATARPITPLATKWGFVLDPRGEAAAIEVAYAAAEATPFPGQAWQSPDGVRFVHRSDDYAIEAGSRLIYDSRIGRERA